MGKKNCELGPDDIERICDTYLSFKETEQSKIFPNKAFGYWKVVVERPLRLHSQLTVKAIEALRFASGDEELRSEFYDRLGEPLFENFASVQVQLEKLVSESGTGDDVKESENSATAKKGLPEKKKKLLDARTWERDGKLVETANALRRELGENVFDDHNVFRNLVDAALDKLGIMLNATDRKLLLSAVSWRVDTAPPVLDKVHKSGKKEADPLHGLYDATIDGKRCVVEYETDTDLRDTEQVPLLEPGGIEAFIRREVLPHTPDAWIDGSATKIG